MHQHRRGSEAARNTSRRFNGRWPATFARGRERDRHGIAQPHADSRLSLHNVHAQAVGGRHGLRHREAIAHSIGIDRLQCQQRSRPLRPKERRQLLLNGADALCQASRAAVPARERRPSLGGIELRIDDLWRGCGHGARGARENEATEHDATMVARKSAEPGLGPQTPRMPTLREKTQTSNARTAATSERERHVQALACFGRLAANIAAMVQPSLGTSAASAATEPTEIHFDLCKLIQIIGAWVSRS